MSGYYSSICRIGYEGKKNHMLKTQSVNQVYTFGEYSCLIRVT